MQILQHYITLFLVACNTTKLVPKGDALYTGATVKVSDSTLSKKQKNKSCRSYGASCPGQFPTANF